MTTTLTIALGERSYPIHIGAGLLVDGEAIAASISGSQVLIVSNEAVAPLYLDPVLKACREHDVQTLVLPDGEDHKSPANWQRVLDTLAAMKASRDATLVALGGGVIGDLTGFAAATWMRGVPFVQIPTTLLAQVDASVGGKTAVNHPAGKNLVGAFHQPVAVIIDTLTLDTLPEREYRAGLAEVLKYGLIRDRGFFDWVDAQAASLLARNPGPVAEAIERSCRHKAEIVAADEREAGMRALLNLGHTFGHAIESVAGYGEVLHGEAVAIGCCLAARVAERMGLCSSRDAEITTAALGRLGLPTTVPKGLDSRSLLAAMQLDKKNLSGRLRLVLPTGIGAARVDDSADTEMLLAVMDAVR